MNKVKFFAYALILFLVSGLLMASVSIGTRYGTIVLEEVSPGRVYNITEMRDLPYTVINRGSTKGNVNITVFPPREPREDYEPIADPNWLTVRPSEFELEAGESMPTSLILNIPDDEKYKGRHFHALIRVQSGRGGGVGAAVVNNFFFSVGSPGPEAVREARAREVLSDLNYDVNPESLFIEVPAGEEFDILQELDRSLQIINRGRQDVKLVINSIENRPGYSAADGYSFTSSPEYLWAEPGTMAIESYQVRDVNLFAKIPEEYKGEKLMFLVGVHPEGMDFANLYSRVFVSVK